MPARRNAQNAPNAQMKPAGPARSGAGPSRSPAGPQRRPFLGPKVAAPAQTSPQSMQLPPGDPAAKINAPAPMPAFAPVKLPGMK